MYHKIAFGVILACAVLSGCASAKDKPLPSTVSSASPGVSTEATTGANAQATTSPVATSTGTPAEKAEKLSDEEALALDYIYLYHNTSDLAVKKKFVAEHLHPDVQPLFAKSQTEETPERNKFKNARVVESADYTDGDGQKVKAVLIQGEKTANLASEVIILIRDKKVSWATESVAKEEFDPVRRVFQAPVPAVVETPPVKLNNIVNFVIDKVWNEGFADVGMYILMGYSSTGEDLDIEVTVAQLGKTMSQKKEYDSYITGLGEEYAAAKKAWTTLSAEADRLYEQTLQHPPKAEDITAQFDVKSFNQYLDDFQDEVNRLLK